MSEIWQLVSSNSSGLGLWGRVVLGLLFVFSFVLYFRVWLSIRRLSEWARVKLVVSLRDQAPPEDALSARLLADTRATVVASDQERIILKRPIRDVLEGVARDELSNNWAGVVGPSYTGIALIVTFMLIALVLANDVGPAISASTDAGNESSQKLAEAVRTMGTKFVISSFGILLAILHQVMHRAFQAASHRSVSAVVTVLEPKFISLEQHQFHSDFELKKTLEREGEMTRKELASLSKIEVSVKDLGHMASQELGKLMRNAIAEELAQSIAELRATATDVQEQLTQEMKGLAAQQVEQLTAIRKALEGQSSSQVEQLLTKLSDVISGGFSSETKNMSTLLTQFSGVFPRLGAQLGEMTDKMQQVLGSLDAQQQQSTALIQSIAQATNENVQRLSVDLAQAGSDAMARVLGESREQIDQIVAGLRETARNNAGSAVSLHEQFQKVSETAAAMSKTLVESAERMAATARNTESLVAASARANSAVQQNTERLAAVAEAFSGSVDRLSALQRQADDLYTQQAMLLRLHTEQTEQMQRVWPQLLGQVTTGVRESSTQLGETWSKLATNLKEITLQHGAEFGDSVEGLTASVDKLQELLELARTGNGVVRR